MFTGQNGDQGEVGRACPPTWCRGDPRKGSEGAGGVGLIWFCKDGDERCALGWGMIQNGGNWRNRGRTDENSSFLPGLLAHTFQPSPPRIHRSLLENLVPAGSGIKAQLCGAFGAPGLRLHPQVWPAAAAQASAQPRGARLGAPPAARPHPPAGAVAPSLSAPAPAPAPGRRPRCFLSPGHPSPGFSAQPCSQRRPTT